jgi:hypothetical protein
MPKKYIVFFKSIGKKWFIILIVAILIVAIYELVAAIVLTGITIVLFMLSYVPVLFFKNTLIRKMSKFQRIEDKSLARMLDKRLKKIQEKMFKISQNQKKRKWLIVYFNKSYIFYNELPIEKFNEFYSKGYEEKEILEVLKEFNFKTRAEIKAIRETLTKHNRLSDREVSVRQHKEDLRFTQD